MTNQSSDEQKKKPTHTVSFSRIIGDDEDGKSKLGAPREIGAVWPRKGDKKGGIIRLDHIPVELTRHEGVLFILPLE